MKQQDDAEAQEAADIKLEKDMAKAADHLKKLSDFSCETCDTLSEKIADKKEFLDTVESQKSKNVLNLQSVEGFMNTIVNDEQRKLMHKVEKIAEVVKPMSLDMAGLQRMATGAAGRLPGAGNQFVLQQFTVNNPVYGAMPGANQGVPPGFSPNRSYYRGSML